MTTNFKCSEVIKRRNVNCVTVLEKESIRKLPINYNEIDVKIFINEAIKIIPGCHAKIVKNVNIVDNSLFEIFKHQNFSSYSNSGTVGRKDTFLRSLKCFQILKPAKKIPRAIWATDYLSAGYFHWLTDVLTRLELINQYWNQYPVLLPEQFKSISYITDSLDILGVTYAYIPESGRCQIHELLLTSYTAPTGNYNNELLNNLAMRFRKWALKNSLSSSNKYQKKRRIYISREFTYRRKILNEAEIVPILKEYGFEIVYAESMSLREQINLFHSASIVVGLHGAGLTNMLFMSSGSSVIEIRRSGDLHNNCFYSMASELKHNYYYLFSNPVSDDLIAGDCHLDSRDLRKLLATI